MLPVVLMKLRSYHKRSYCLLLETLSYCLINCYWVLKSKTKIKQLLLRLCKMDFNAINLQMDGRNGRRLCRFVPLQVNGKADNENYTVLLFAIGEKWKNPYGFWTLLCHFFVKYGLRWVRMGYLDNSILLMPVFRKTPFLVLRFSNHTLIFLMLSVIL